MNCFNVNHIKPFPPWVLLRLLMLTLLDGIGLVQSQSIFLPVASICGSLFSFATSFFEICWIWRASRTRRFRLQRFILLGCSNFRNLLNPKDCATIFLEYVDSLALASNPQAMRKEVAVDPAAICHVVSIGRWKRSDPL